MLDWTSDLEMKYVQIVILHIRLVATDLGMEYVCIVILQISLVVTVLGNEICANHYLTS